MAMKQIQQGKKVTGASSLPSMDNTTAANAAAGGIREGANIAASGIRENSANAARNIQQGYAAAMPLLQRLESFGAKVLDQGTKKMVYEAKQQAVVDVENGTFNDAGLTRGFSVYDQAYNGAAETAYISQTNQEIKNSVDRVAAENPHSVINFENAWNAQKKEISENSNKISPYIEAVTSDSADQYGLAASTRIAAAESGRRFDMQKEDNSLAISLYEQEFIQAKLAGNENAAMTALLNRKSTLKSMQDNFQISARGAEASNKIFEKSVITAQVQSQFASAMSTGSGVDFALNFKKSVKDNPSFVGFSIAEVDGMVGEMYKSIKGENAFRADVEKSQVAQYENLNKDVTETFSRAGLAGTLTQTAVDEALNSNAIDESQYKYYSELVHDTGARFTDTGVELMVIRNLATLSENDIMSIKNMTNEDKMKYVSKAQAYKASDEGKWTSTVQGRASLQLLQNQYNITQSSILAKITKPEDMQNYNEAFQSFILEMENLPADQRESKSMHFAQASIDSQAVKKESRGKLNTDTVKLRNVESIRQRAKQYQKKVGKVKSEAYIQGLAEFMQGFSITGDVKFNKKKWEL